MACKASGIVFLNARRPKIGLVNTANIGQFQVAVGTLSGYMRSGTSGCKMLIPDMQNQDQRPKATAVLHETRTDEFIKWKNISRQHPCGPTPSTLQHPEAQTPGHSFLCNRI